MHPRLCCSLIVLLAACRWLGDAPANAETIVVPNINERTPGASNNGIPFDSDPMRYQQVYAADQFGGTSGVITQLAFRVDESEGGQFDPYSFPAQIWLAHTDRNPQELSSVFDENPGPDKTLVFDGLMTIASQGLGDFDIILDIADVFLYNGTGNLLFEMKTLDFVFACICDSAGVGIGEGGTPWTDRLFAVGPDATTGESVGDDGLVTQFTIVPEPMTALLLACGLIAAARRR